MSVNTMENSKKTLATVLDPTLLLMVPSMKGIGEIMSPVEKEFFGGKMDPCTMDIGRMVSLSILVLLLAYVFAFSFL
jgi:hypothetical protein